jgi:hypothetical protein
VLPLALVNTLRSFLDSTLLKLLAWAGFLAYAYAFWQAVQPEWFHPDWATDDSMQQVYPFHRVMHPELFQGDLITKMMVCYLAPLHYWISWGITWLTQDPVMMGHWVMLLQMLGALVFVFWAVRHSAGLVPALFAVTWLLHTRHVMQRMTGGLPRGWSPTVLAAFLYFVLSGKHWGVIATLVVGCILHTPSTLIAALAYGLYLIWNVVDRSTRAEFWPHLKRYLLVSPLCALLAVSVVKMPEELGTMATLERAASMPEFQRAGGRFTFLPLNPVENELRSFGLQAFVGRFYKPPWWLDRYMGEIALSLMTILAFIGFVRSRAIVPRALWCFLLSSLAIYFLSRPLAFRLYVPDRHLQIPLALFFITAFSIGFWRLGIPKDDEPRGSSPWTAPLALMRHWKGAALLTALAALIYAGSGTGLYGKMNFNWYRTKRGEVWTWFKQHTPLDAVVAGHPTWIDPVMLYGARQGYVTTEVAHPFYDKYYAEMKRRTEIALRMHYATDWADVKAAASAEGIDYLVFQRSLFRPQALARTRYFEPFNAMLQEVRERPPEDFVYFSLPEQPKSAEFPALVYVDRLSKVVEISKLP